MIGRVKVLCMANSRKYGGRCVAGLRLDGQGWVRPVSHYDYGTLFPEHYRVRRRTGSRVLNLLQYFTRTELRPLDIFEMELGEPRAAPYQAENVALARLPWILLRRTCPPDPEIIRILRRAMEDGPELFGNLSDRVSTKAISRSPRRSSLALTRPERVRWRIRTSPRARKQGRALFELQGRRYDLSITDPAWERRLDHLPEGTHPLDAAGPIEEGSLWFTLSLGEPFEGDCYKLVAAVIRVPKTWRTALASA